jgi:hypothetical protein
MLSTLSKWLGFRRRPQRPHRAGTVRTGKPRRWVPQFEMLETRLTPSEVRISMALTHILHINNESIVLRVNSNRSTTLLINGVDRGTDFSHQIFLTADGGTNSFTVDSRAVFSGAAITTDVFGQQRVTVGSFDPFLNRYTLSHNNNLFATKTLVVSQDHTETVTIANNTNSLAGTDGWTVNGGPETILNVRDSGSSSRTIYQIDGNQLRLNNTLFASYNGFRALNLFTSAGSNAVSVKTAAPNTAITVTGGAGGTSFNIGAGNLDAIAGFNVTVNGRGSANDKVAIDDSNATAGQTYQIGSFNVDTVVARGRLRVTSSNVQSLRVNGARFSTYNVENTVVPTTLNGIGSFNIGTTIGNLDFLRGHVTVHGIDANISQVAVFDNRSNVNNTYTIKADSVTRDRFAGLTYDNVALLTLDRSVGNDVYNVLSTSADTRLSHGGGGTNTFNLGTGNLDALRGPVTVSGNGGTNAVVVNDNTAPSFANYAISSNAVTRPRFAGLTYAGVQSLTLNGGSAGAVYTVTSTLSSTPITLNGGAGTNTFTVASTLSPITLNGGAGNDTFNIGNGKLDSLSGRVTVNGNGGTNAVVVNDNAADSGFTYTISSDAVTKAGFGGLTYGSVQSVTLNGASLNTYIVASTSVSTTLSATASDFRINDLDSVRGHLAVHGIDARGGNVLLFDNSKANNTYTIKADAVTRDRFAGLTYDNVAALNLEHGGGGDDVYNVLSTSTITHLSHRSGGTSTFNIGDNLDLLRGEVTVSGSIFLAPTLVNVNDRGAPSGKTYTVTRDTVTRTGAAAIHYFGTAIGPTGGPTELTLSAGNFGNTINVQSMTDTTRLATINPGAAGDRINITNAAHALDGIGSVSVLDRFRASTLTVDDSGSTTPHTYTLTLGAPTSTFTRSAPGPVTITFSGIPSQGLNIKRGAVLGAPPQAADLTFPTTIATGHAATLRGRLVGTGALSLSVDWGDDSPPAQSTPDRRPFRVQHPYAQPGTYSVRAVWTDSSGQSGFRDRTLTVTGPDDDAKADPNQRFVAAAFQDLLHRDVDPAGLAAFSTFLARGGSRAQVAQAIVASPEYRTLVVRDVYARLLQREADAAGLAAFVSLLGAGGTVAQVQAQMAASPEYAQLHGGSPDDFLAALYGDLLGRTPDPVGQAAFGQALAAGTDRGAVAAAIVGSAEYQARLVNDYFQRLLDRDADPTGLAAFSGALGAGTHGDAVVTLIASSDEFFARLA